MYTILEDFENPRQSCTVHQKCVFILEWNYEKLPGSVVHSPWESVHPQGRKRIAWGAQKLIGKVIPLQGV